MKARTRTLLLATLALGSFWASIAEVTAKEPDRAQVAVRELFRQYVKERASDDPRDPRPVFYLAKRVHLHNGPGQQFLVYLSGMYWCGSGGCDLYVVTYENNSARITSIIDLVRLPVRVMQSKTHGWHDLGVLVQGGGILYGYEGLIPYDGTKYAENSTVPPARHARKSAVGTVVFDPIERPKLLFD